MTEENLKAYFEIYTDCWKLFRKYANPDGSDEFWQSLYDESKMLYEKHGKSELARVLLIATTNEVDRIDKKQKSGLCK